MWGHLSYKMIFRVSRILQSAPSHKQREQASSFIILWTPKIHRLNRHCLGESESPATPATSEGVRCIILGYPMFPPLIFWVQEVEAAQSRGSHQEEDCCWIFALLKKSDKNKTQSQKRLILNNALHCK